MIELLHTDCMEYMKGLPDKAFELAIVDPPYGLNVITGRSFGDPLRKNGTIRHGIDKRNGAKIVRKASTYIKKDWDKVHPNEEYFNELFRVSKNQIVWGANHFISKMPYDSPAWVIWDKINGSNDFADCEMAWTSFKRATRIFSFMWNGMLQGSESDGKIMEGSILKREKRIHPTQKPIKLYKWLLHNYAKEGDKILDTHGGSRSLAIACHQMGFDHVSCEIDIDYHNDSVKRFNNAIMQQSLFK